MSKRPCNWFIEYTSAHEAHMHSVKRMIVSCDTKYQRVEIMDMHEYGLCLALDGKIQSTERDEFIYHEALVQLPMLLHSCPEYVFILGGGEGATAREALKHPMVKRVCMVDIDEEVVNLCRKELYTIHEGAFDDERLQLLFMDARKYLEEESTLFDIIIVDVTDPVEEGPSAKLFTKQFYKLLLQHLKGGGIACMQAGPANYNEIALYASVCKTVSQVFRYSLPYQVFVPSFTSLWGFVMASESIDPYKITASVMDERIRERRLKLKFFDAQTFKRLLHTEKHIREAIREANVIDDKEPLLLYG